MLGIERQFVSNSRRFSLDEIGDVVAQKVANGIVRELAEKLVQPRPQEDRNPEAKVVTVLDAARLLGLSRSTIWQYIKEKRIDAIHSYRTAMYTDTHGDDQENSEGWDSRISGANLSSESAFNRTLEDLHAGLEFLTCVH
jgi:hypothetical protein